MVREFSQLIHLMEKGFQPMNYGSGWKIEHPDPVTSEISLVDVDNFAIAQAKRFDCIQVLQTEAGHVAVLKHDNATQSEPEYPIPSSDLSMLKDPQRLDAIEKTGLLDSPPEEDYDRLTRLASSVLKCPVSTISIVSDEKQWFKSQKGLSGEIAEHLTTPVDNSLCKYVAANKADFIVTDAFTHPLTKGIPIVKELNIQAYAGAPIFSHERHCVGAFCVIDHKPRKWTCQEVVLLKEFADLTSLCIESHELRLKLVAENEDLRHKLAPA